MGGRGAAGGGGGSIAGDITDQEQAVGESEFQRLLDDGGVPYNYRYDDGRFTEEEREAWAEYTYNGYMEINAYHRTGDYDRRPSERLDMYTQALDQYTSRNSLDRDVTVYRSVGTGATAARLSQPQRVGEVFTDAGFMSTSLTPAGAAFLAHQGDTAPVMRIRAPRGTRYGIGTDYEQELILPRNTGVRITGVSRQTINVTPTDGTSRISTRRVVIDAVID